MPVPKAPAPPVPEGGPVIAPRPCGFHSAAFGEAAVFELSRVRAVGGENDLDGHEPAVLFELVKEWYGN